MTLEMLVSAALMDYSQSEQTKILKAIEEDKLPTTKRLHNGVMKVMEVFDAYEPVVEGYAGFQMDRETVAKKKREHGDDRNVGRVVQSGGQSMLITGKKADGRYIVVGKKGEKTAKDAADLGVTTKEGYLGVDIEDLHQEMLEGLKQARKNVGASKCWDGYKAKGTKTKGGKQVPNCVKEEEVEEGYKPIDKSKENKMYRRAGNLARTSLSSKGKAKEDAQNKSGKIVSAIARQKENERFAKMGDEKARNNYKEEVEQVDELYKGKHGQSDKEYADSRSSGGKMVSGDSKMSGAEYTHGRRVKAANPGMQPDVGGKTKPKSQGKMDKGTRADLQYRKANLKAKNEDFINKLSASGLFTEAELLAMEEME
jgi:hypothetical protein